MNNVYNLLSGERTFLLVTKWIICTICQPIIYSSLQWKINYLHYFGSIILGWKLYSIKKLPFSSLPLRKMVWISISLEGSFSFKKLFLLNISRKGFVRLPLKTTQFQNETIRINDGIVSDSISARMLQSKWIYIYIPEMLEMVEMAEMLDFSVFLLAHIINDMCALKKEAWIHLNQWQSLHLEVLRLNFPSVRLLFG